MDPLSVAASVVALLDIAISVVRAVSSSAASILFLLEYYGVAGAFVFVFGNGPIWRIQLDVLNSNDRNTAMDFRKLLQDENSMVAITSAIFVQVAVTALSLPSLGEVHWTAQACIAFSFVTAVMAVYSASSQYQTLGRLFTHDQIKHWIAGGDGRGKLLTNSRYFESDKYLPAISAVLISSAPSNLLAASVYSFLVGLGIYFGLLWSENLGTMLSDQGNLAVFATYLGGLTLCWTIYMLSSVVQGRGNFVYVTSLWLGSFRDIEIVHDAGNHGNANRRADVAAVPRVNPEHAGIGIQAARREERSSEERLRRMDLRAAFLEAAHVRREMARVDQRISELLSSASIAENIVAESSGAPRGN